MSDPIPAQPAAPKPTPPVQDPTPQQAEVDWKARFEAQQTVNRDLEKKLNDIRDSQKAQADSLAKALGLKPEESTDASKLAGQVATLQGSFQQMQHDNMVLLVAREHGLADQADVDLLRAVGNEETMRGVAKRLAAAAESGSGKPKPDLTQGGHGRGDAGSPAQDFAAFIGKQLGQ